MTTKKIKCYNPSCAVKYLNVVTTENDPKETANQRHARILSCPTHGSRHAGRSVRRTIPRPTIPPITNKFG